MIPKEFWERFKNEKIAVNCQTEEESYNFINQCCHNSFLWDANWNNNKNKSTTYYYVYQSNTCYSFNKILGYADINFFNSQRYEIIPFSEINKSIKEENKMQVKPNEYTYRGQAFSDVEEYAKYILKCKEEDRVKAEKERQDKLKVEQVKRQEELNKAYDEYVNTCKNAKQKYENIVKQFIKEYGQNAYSRYINIEDMINLIWER